jgi:hypothetical protein
MASLKLPEPLIIGLSKILSLTEESIQELIIVIESYPLKIHQHRVFDDELWSNLKTIEPDNAKAVIETLFGLYMGKVNAPVPLSSYVDDIAQALKLQPLEDVQWAKSEETLNKFKERLLRLLSSKPLEIVAKAYHVLLEHEHTLSQVRILSDIRPIFGEDVDISPQAAVIVHMLKIDYMEAGRPKEFFVALDTKDISYLMDILKRAESKATSLKSAVNASNIAYVEVV